jgi:hypothetical protein
MRSKCLIPREIQDLLEKKYNIVGNIEFKDFDHDLQFLRNFFQTTKKNSFDSLDRYIIEHQDTDIYVPEMCVGVNIRNFFEIVNELDIPLFTILIWTNHFGLQKEIDVLTRGCHPNNRPTIIESFCARTHVANSYQEVDIAENEIKFHGLSMMGSNRSHRYALYHALKHLSPDKLAISIRGVK